MLVRIKWSQGGPEATEKRGKPEELACETLKVSDRTIAGGQNVIGKVNQSAELGRIETDCEAFEVHLPSDPYHGGGESAFVPAHRNFKAQEQDDHDGGPEGGGKPVKQSQDVIDINPGRVPDAEQSFEKADK